MPETVTVTTFQFFLFLACVFIAMVTMPYACDYAFFVLHDEASWFWASVTSAMLLIGVIVIIMHFSGL